jgi:hypothetical protein
MTTRRTGEHARLEVENDALQFECSLLRRENERVIGMNRALEARVVLAEQERDRLRDYLSLIQRSLPWRIAQTLRGFIGRKW